MTALACPPCGLRVGLPARSLCPQCERELVTLRCEQAVGLRLFTAPDVSLPALQAAIAAFAKT
jgi:uncharacterized OB-fold protein